MSIESIKVPDIGSDSVELIEICVAVGDQVAEEQSLVVLESDKASMEVPSPMTGTVIAIKIAEGDSLSEGDVILELETAASELDAPTIEAPVTKAEVATEPVVAQQENAVIAEPAASIVEMINIPDIGGAENVEVIEVCVAPGDDVAEGDSLIVLETDKASVEVPAPKAGKVISLKVKEGDQVSEGAELMEMEVLAVASAAAAIPIAASTAVSASAVSPAVESVTTAAKSTQSEIPAPAHSPVETALRAADTGQAVSQSSIYAGPAVRRLAREMGVELTKVKGSGPKGRIAKDDLKAFVKTALSAKASTVAGAGIPAIAEVDFSKFGDVSIEPLTKLHKVVAANMHRSWLNVPHVTQFDEADITELEDFRQSLKAEAQQRGTKITPMPFLLKACAMALKAHPKFNASLHADGEHMVYKQYVNIGIAVDTPAGLMVPVLRDVDKKSIWDIAAEIAELADKAKHRKLKPAEMQGGCFTISSLGGIGGQGFTPIVNVPEVAILGVSKLAVKPLWNGEEFLPRKMLPLSLSYDHRAINGGDAGRFFTYLGELLADIRKMVL